MTVRYVGYGQEAGGVASGTHSHAEGTKTTASGIAAHAEGNSGDASGLYSHAEGIATTASGITSHAEGDSSVASGSTTHAQGHMGVADAPYMHAHGAFRMTGVSRFQSALYGLSARTATTSARTLTFDASLSVNFAPPNNNVLLLPTYVTYSFQLQLVARREVTATASQGWLLAGLVARDTGAPRMVGAVTQLATWTDATSQGTVAITVHTINNYLNIAVTPASGTATYWLGTLRVTELQTQA